MSVGKINLMDGKFRRGSYIPFHGYVTVYIIYLSTYYNILNLKTR